MYIHVVSGAFKCGAKNCVNGSTCSLSVEGGAHVKVYTNVVY